MYYYLPLTKTIFTNSKIQPGWQMLETTTLFPIKYFTYRKQARSLLEDSTHQITCYKLLSKLKEVLINLKTMTYTFLELISQTIAC